MYKIQVVPYGLGNFITLHWDQYCHQFEFLGQIKKKKIAFRGIEVCLSTWQTGTKQFIDQNLT